MYFAIRRQLQISTDPTPTQATAEGLWQFGLALHTHNDKTIQTIAFQLPIPEY